MSVVLLLCVTGMVTSRLFLDVSCVTGMVTSCVLLVW